MGLNIVCCKHPEKRGSRLRDSEEVSDALQHKMVIKEATHSLHLLLSMSKSLKWVNLSGYDILTELHPSVLSLDTLETLTPDGCKKPSNLKSENGSKSLMKVSVKGWTSLKEFSVSSDKMESLDLNNAGIEKLHLSFEFLQVLRISNCKLLTLEKQNLHALFDGLGSLKLLHLKDCKKLSKLPRNVSVLAKLRELRLDGSSTETLPASIKHLSGARNSVLRELHETQATTGAPASRHI